VRKQGLPAIKGLPLKPASKGQPQCMNLSLRYTFADLAVLHSAGMGKSIAQAHFHATSLPFEKASERQGLMQFKVFTKLAAARCNGFAVKPA